MASLAGIVCSAHMAVAQQDSAAVLRGGDDAPVAFIKCGFDEHLNLVVEDVDASRSRRRGDARLGEALLGRDCLNVAAAFGTMPQGNILIFEERVDNDIEECLILDLADGGISTNSSRPRTMACNANTFLVEPVSSAPRMRDDGGDARRCIQVLLRAVENAPEFTVSKARLADGGTCASKQGLAYRYDGGPGGDSIAVLGCRPSGNGLEMLFLDVSGAPSHPIEPGTSCSDARRFLRLRGFSQVGAPAAFAFSAVEDAVGDTRVVLGAAVVSTIFSRVNLH